MSSFDHGVRGCHGCVQLRTCKLISCPNLCKERHMRKCPRTTEATEAPEVAQTPEVEEPATPEPPAPRRVARSAGGPAPVMPGAGVSPMRAARAQQHAQAEAPREEPECELQQAQIISMFTQKCNHWSHSQMGKPPITNEFGGFTKGLNRAAQAVCWHLEHLDLRPVPMGSAHCGQ